MKGEISACTAIMLNDHSNPYIESTTALSDILFKLHLPAHPTCNLRMIMCHTTLPVVWNMQHHNHHVYEYYWWNELFDQTDQN